MEIKTWTDKFLTTSNGPAMYSHMMHLLSWDDRIG